MCHALSPAWLSSIKSVPVLVSLDFLFLIGNRNTVVQSLLLRFMSLRILQ
jgi:hypothetical protein